MDFDQKAIKFLANFYINGNKHWTHGPLGQKSASPCQPKRMIQMAGQECQELPGGLRVCAVNSQVLLPTCIYSLKELLEWRPPILTDLEVPGPTKYLVPEASMQMRESSPHPHYTIGRKAPSHGGPACTRWLPSLWSQAPLPAFPHTTSERRPSLQTWGVPVGDILQSPRSAAFMSRSPAFTSWISTSHSPGPGVYHVKDGYNSRFPSAPGVVIQGTRRPKRHDTGPFSTL
ncbi:PREDICTED: uncharacterized protein C9orf173 homolog [Elephantulus edwardii]|uniref:uncharacterized protein C9orf173 homolog n=1 Tax=Elephantulus edwardii TaxID=28737 RepID=UPI0003F0C46D|nr:PREDICTED: uncharacterized protein C9orf173 homolog [Elephantulus edwardii]